MLQSTYERGMKELDKTKMGTTAMGELSHIESIRSKTVRERDPIVHDPEYVPRRPDHLRKGDYNPILQKYVEERDGASKVGSISTQRGDH